MPELHPLLAARWSPRAFDRTAELTDAEVASLVEAARWAPSAGNSQPWRFIVGRRDEERHKRILANLHRDAQRWAGRAAALILAAHTRVGGLSGRGGRHREYDLGQAVAHLSVQATALSLYVHQIFEFDAGALRGDLDLADHLTPTVVLAIGRLDSPDSLPDDLRAREVALRWRHPASALLIADR